MKETWQETRLASRVWILSSNGRFLFHVPPSRAIVMLKTGTCILGDDSIREKDGKRKIGSLMLVQTPGSIWKPPIVPTVHSFKTPPSVTLVRHVRVGMAPGTFEFTQRDKRDRWAYLLSITENLRKVVEA